MQEKLSWLPRDPFALTPDVARSTWIRRFLAWPGSRFVMPLPMFAVAVAAFAVHLSSARAHPHEMAAHRGVPSPIVVDRRVGPYVASVWTDPEVGSGPVYVVLEPADGQTFTSPSAVHVGVVPVSGRLPEVVHDAHPEHVRSGGRFMTNVVFDRAERWNLRVLIDGAAGGGELTSEVDAKPNASLGSFALVLSSLPFVVMGVVWWRAAVTRRRTNALP